MKQQQMDLGKDPKTMVTPRAFTIAEAVLYTPLATPLKRALAIMIDALLITVLAEQMDWMFVLLVAGILYIEKRSRKLGRLLKWALYALMLVFMLLVTADNLVNVHALVEPSGDESSSAQQPTGKAVIMSIPTLVSLSLCEDYDCGHSQIQSLQKIIATSSNDGVSELREMVLNTLKDSAINTADRERLQTDVLNGSLWPSITPQMEATLTNEQLATVLDNTAEPAPPEPQPLLKQDTVDGESPLSPMVGSVQVDETDITSNHSVVAWVKGFLSDMGLGFGWAAFYFTVFTAWFDGQTLGKKLLGIRVIQLDGANISLWAAFGRYGGYAAGFTTGLLGFIQIFWDANRQGIQDKISSTVVIDLVQMHKKQRLEQQAQRQDVMSVPTSDLSTSAHLTTSTRSEHL